MGFNETYQILVNIDNNTDNVNLLGKNKYHKQNTYLIAITLKKIII